jgi:hypothetical protein
MNRPKQLCIVVLLLSTSTISHAAASKPASEEVRQLAVIPNFLTETGVVTATQAMDAIEAKRKTYSDYGGRMGGIWSDFTVDTNNPNPTRECEGRIRLTQVAEQRVEKPKSRVPESVFDYPEMRTVLAQEILPKMFAFIRTNGWTTLPEKVFTQFYLQRCNTSEAMDWHQDPGEPEWDTMAHYSLVLMLGKQDDPVRGWHGGEFRIRSGKPNDTDDTPIKTIIHKFNQAVLFNNQLNCHRAEAVTGTETSQRDLIVTMIYLGKAPEPVPEYDQRALYAEDIAKSQE